MHYSKGIIPFAVTLIAAVFLLILSLSVPKATGASDTVTMQVTITGEAPSFGAITCTPSPLTPTAGTNTTVECHSTITDTNGYGDVNQSLMNASFYYGGLGTAVALDDLNIHYSNGSYSQIALPCAFYSGSGTTITVQCNFTTRYFIQPGLWWINFTIGDKTLLNTSINTSLTVNTVLGINIIETSIDFSNVALGGTSGEKNTTIANLGNANMDMNLSIESGTLDCPSPYSDITTNAGATGLGYNVTNGFAFTSGVQITGSAVIYPEFNLVYYNASGTTDGTSNKTLSWLLKLPATGIGGTCNSTTTMVTTTDVAPLAT